MLNYSLYKPKNPSKSAIFMFHGWGQTSRHMQKFFPLWQGREREDFLIALQAPYWREKPKGYSWFTMKNRVRDAFSGEKAQDIRLNQLIPAIKAEEDTLEQTIAHIRQAHSIEYIHFIGFSQGAMMVLYMGLKMQVQTITSIAGYGALELLDEIEDIKASRILLLTGAKDKIVPPAYQHKLYGYLKQRQAHVSLDIVENIKHMPLSDALMIKAQDFSHNRAFLELL